MQQLVRMFLPFLFVLPAQIALGCGVVAQAPLFHRVSLASEEDDLTVGDLHVTDLPTNIRSGDGGTEQYGNSIFIFQTAGLCIAHLSHLRQQPEIRVLPGPYF